MSLDALDLEIEDIPAPETPEKKNLLGRFKSMMDARQAEVSASPAPRRTKAKKGEIQASFIDVLTPFLCFFALWLMELALREDYAALMMEPDEADGVLRPLVRILARKMDISGHLSEDGVDILASALALTMYGQRIRPIWRQIQHDKRASERGGHQNTDRTDDHRDIRSRQSQQVAIFAPTPYGAQNGQQATSQDNGSRPDPLSDLLQADAIGRREQGLGQ